MKTCNTEYEHLVRDLVKQQCGERASALQPVPTYPDSIVYQIELPSGPVIFKAMDPAGVDPHGIALEAWACERVRQAGVPAPEVLVLDTSQRVFPSTYSVMRKAAGRPLAELGLARDGERPFVRQVGQHLRRMHAIVLEGYGWLDEALYLQTGAVRGVHATWRRFLLHEIEPNLHWLIAAGALEPGRVDNVRRLLQQHAALLDYAAPGSLLHGDLGSLHVWVDLDRGQVTSLVDFGERKAGDPIWDLVEYDWKARDALLEGYGVAAAEREFFDRRYYLYAVLRAIPWARRWYPLGGTQISRWLNFTLTEAEQCLL